MLMERDRKVRFVSLSCRRQDLWNGRLEIDNMWEPSTR
jgi:hypothetical protein